MNKAEELQTSAADGSAKEFGGYMAHLRRLVVVLASDSVLSS